MLLLAVFVAAGIIADVWFDLFRQAERVEGVVGCILLLLLFVVVVGSGLLMLRKTWYLVAADY